MSRPLTAMLGDRYGSSRYSSQSGETVCAPAAAALVKSARRCLACDTESPHADYCPECCRIGEDSC